MNRKETHDRTPGVQRVVAAALLGLCALGLWAPAAQAQAQAQDDCSNFNFEQFTRIDGILIEPNGRWTPLGRA